MSSINQHPTFSYSQPEEYHFSHDSVFFAHWLAEQARTSGWPRILDLCSGCGIIGMDLLFHLVRMQKCLPQTFDFLEVQEVYGAHHHLNLQNLIKSCPEIQAIKSELFIQNYEQELSQKYDLILSNPPYFLKGSGTLSPSEFKNRCRFFLDSDFPRFLNFLKNHLQPSGSAYFLMRLQEQHGIDLESFFSTVASRCQIVKASEIRGTSVFKLTLL